MPVCPRRIGAAGSVLPQLSDWGAFFGWVSQMKSCTPGFHRTLISGPSHLHPILRSRVRRRASSFFFCRGHRIGSTCCWPPSCSCAFSALLLLLSLVFHFDLNSNKVKTKRECCTSHAGLGSGVVILERSVLGFSLGLLADRLFELFDFIMLALTRDTFNDEFGQRTEEDKSSSIWSLR